jgi:cation transport ATPase
VWWCASGRVLQEPLRTLVWGFPLGEILKWLLTTPIQFWVGWRFHVGAFRSLCRRAANMDVLISLGTNASYFYSAFSVLHRHFSVRPPALLAVAGPTAPRCSAPWRCLVRAWSRRCAQSAARSQTGRPTGAHPGAAVPQLQGARTGGANEATDFFETCAMLITFICMGKYLEAAAKGRTSEAITALLRLAPATALVLHVDAHGEVVEEEEVPTALVQHGDLLKARARARAPPHNSFSPLATAIFCCLLWGEPRSHASPCRFTAPCRNKQANEDACRSELRRRSPWWRKAAGGSLHQSMQGRQRAPVCALGEQVLPGARLPADGTVEDGHSHCDESMLTGESVPVAKAPGAAVIAGTVNQGGMLLVRATRVGTGTALAQIVRLVEAAQLAKAPIQAFADRVSSIFVPIIVSISLLTLAAW